MKRHFLLHLLLTVLVPLAFSESRYSHYLNPEWLRHLNATQKGMVLEEFENYGREMDKLNLTEEQEMNKVHEMISKVRDGFWIYRLSSMNEALADSVKTFNKTTGLKVYVYSYVEDPGFLNNIFKRLSEAKYINLVPEGYIIYKLTFKRTREPQGEEFIMAYAPTLTVETDQYDKISKKQTELNTLGLNKFTEGTSLNSEQLFGKRESCTRSLTSILAQMKDLSHQTSESAYLSLDLLKAEMEPIKEKVTFITPAGTGITLPAGSKIVDGNYRGDVLSPEGVLFGFLHPSGKLYMARIENFPVLSGYYQYEEKTGRFGQCYTDSEPVTSGRKKIWHIRREEDETARQCSLSVSEGTYNFTAEYSFKLDGTRSSKVISTWDISANYSETSGGKKFQTPCIDKTTSTHPQPLTKKALPQPLDDYAYSLHQNLKKKGIDAAIWLGECAENDQVQVITREQSTHSTLSNTQARRMVETGTFNTGIAIYGCYDPATGKWKIISNFKKGSLKPNAKFKGQLSEEKADQISDEYVEKIVKERSGQGGEAGGLQRTTRGDAERLPDGDEFKHDHLSLFEAVLAIKSFTKSIVEQARVPEEFWNNSPGNLEKYINSPVHIPAVLCGGGDQTLEELTGAVQLLYFGLDLATDPQKARAMYRSLANMKWEDVKSAAEKTLISASGYENYAAGGCKARYQGGRHGVTIAMTVFAITKMAKVKDVIDKAEEGVKEGMKATGKTLAKRLEAYPELSRKVKNLPDGGKAFLDDFADASDEVIKKLGEHPEWVDGWRVLKESGETDLTVRIKDIEFVDGYLQKNPGKAGSVAKEINNKGWQKWADEVSQVSLANYSNVRKYLTNSRTKQYLTNQELLDFEKILKQAHPDVLKHMNEMDEFDFAEMVRGYRDLKNNNKLSTFENAIKSGDSFYGRYGWLPYWKLTPGIKYSLTTIDDLKRAGKLLPTGNASDIQLASLQAFTRNGDYLNVPMRYNKTYLGEYAERGYKNVFECLEELRKVPERDMSEVTVFSGKTFSKEYFERNLVGGVGREINYTSFVSSSIDQSVAEGFIELTAKHAGDGPKVAIIQRIISKDGVYIDDLSDWGKNLGPIRHSDKPAYIQIQKEVLMNPSRFKQVAEPIPIMVNGKQIKIGGFDAYYLDLIQQ